MIKTYLEAGKIINKRGLAGELKIESYCDTPEAFCSFKHVYLAPDGTDVRKFFPQSCIMATLTFVWKA